MLQRFNLFSDRWSFSGNKLHLDSQSHKDYILIEKTARNLYLPVILSKMHVGIIVIGSIAHMQFNIQLCTHTQHNQSTKSSVIKPM